jgi:hypothetical protein
MRTSISITQFDGDYRISMSGAESKGVEALGPREPKKRDTLL